MSTCFHVSATANRTSIRRQGLLLPACGTRLVWVFSDEATARQMPPASWGGSRGRNDLWAVRVADGELDVDPDRGWGDARDRCSFVLDRGVAPDRLRLCATHAPDRPPCIR